MPFELVFTTTAADELKELENNPSLHKRLKAVRKTLGYLEKNPRHPGLQTHEYVSLSKHFGFKVFEAYAEQNTSGAYRIFWHYGPQKNQINIIGIKPHPD